MKFKRGVGLNAGDLEAKAWMPHVQLNTVVNTLGEKLFNSWMINSRMQELMKSAFCVFTPWRAVDWQSAQRPLTYIRGDRLFSQKYLDKHC